VISVPLTCILALAQPWPIALSVYAHGPHRHPVPGEVQSLRWSVHNDGEELLNDVRLEVHPPADWQLRSAPGCRAEPGRLDCSYGALAAGRWGSLTIKMAVPDDPELGTFRITGRTTIAAGNSYLSGPSAALTVTVVKHR
jgi:hypothetical protein